ncbi:hypothetical protein [Rubripirellula reticaptiva]|uniref:hypothetical protein n=1 Tax=Rubripirellula reticaptiva TaxID=2528013 RepID=UPI0016480CC2|nr:hypothetical protein [Rubripirellula reticaptiva]
MYFIENSQYGYSVTLDAGGFVALGACEFDDMTETSPLPVSHDLNSAGGADLSVRNGMIHGDRVRCCHDLYRVKNSIVSDNVPTI